MEFCAESSFRRVIMQDGLFCVAKVVKADGCSWFEMDPGFEPEPGWRHGR